MENENDQGEGRNNPGATEEDPVLGKKVASLLSMANFVAARLTPDQRGFNIDAELYDERGLPR